jgi:mannose/fructose/N-acetylgalactosamine-specific phosphotransferase system component IIC
MEALFGGLLAGLAFLESWPLGQLLLGRPALLLPALGWMLGLPEAGLWLGLCLELLTLRQLPMGSALPPDPALGGLLALLALSLSGAPQAEGMLPATLIAGTALAWPAAWFSELQRRLNGRCWLPRWEAAVAAGNLDRLERLLPLVLLQAWALAAGLAAAALWVLPLLLEAAAPWAARLDGGTGRVGWCLLAIAAGGLLQLAGGRTGSRRLFGGLAAGTLLALLLVAGGLL